MRSWLSMILVLLACACLGPASAAPQTVGGAFGNDSRVSDTSQRTGTLKAKLEGLPAKAVFGTPVRLGVKLSRKERGSLRYVWQASAGDTVFDRGTSVEPLAVLRLGRVGSVKVWVEVQLDNGEGAYNTIATTDPVTVQVAPPKFRVQFAPQKASVGQEVTATVVIEPAKVDPTLVEIRWLPPENGKDLGPVPGKPAMRFIATSDGPVRIRGSAGIARAGEAFRDALGEISASYQALPFKVTVEGPRRWGESPQVWKTMAGGRSGLFPADDAIAVGQQVAMWVDVGPLGTTGDLRFHWTVVTGSATLVNPQSRTPSVIGNSKGPVEIEVAVHNSDNVVLATARGGFAVTVDPKEEAAAQERGETDQALGGARALWNKGEVGRALETLQKAHEKYPAQSDLSALAEEYRQKREQIEGLLKQAREQAQVGKYEEALAITRQAASVNPANPEPNQYGKQLNLDRDKIDKELRRIDTLVRRHQFREAEAALASIQGARPEYQPASAAVSRLAEARRSAEIEEKAAMDRFKTKMEAKDFQGALALGKELRRKGLVGTWSEDLEGWERQCRDQEAAREEARKLFAVAEGKYRRYDYEGAVEDLAEALRVGADLWRSQDSSMIERFRELIEEAEYRARRLVELATIIEVAANSDPAAVAGDYYARALEAADEALALHPGNAKFKEWRNRIVDKKQARLKAKAVAQ